MRHRQELPWQKPACRTGAKMHRRARWRRFAAEPSTFTAPDPRVVDRSRSQSRDCGVPKAGQGIFDRGGLPGQGGSGDRQQADGRAHSLHPGAVRDHGVWADRGDAGGAVSGANPLQRDVAALSHRRRNGWFGGFLPTIAFAMVAATGDIYYGLWYPIVVAALTLVLGLPCSYRRPSSARLMPDR